MNTLVDLNPRVFQLALLACLIVLLASCEQPDGNDGAARIRASRIGPTPTTEPAIAQQTLPEASPVASPTQAQDTPAISPTPPVEDKTRRQWIRPDDALSTPLTSSVWNTADGTLVVSTEHLSIYRRSGSVSEESVIELGPAIEQLLIDVSERLGVDPIPNIWVHFVGPEQPGEDDQHCPARGMSAASGRVSDLPTGVPSGIAWIAADGNTPRSQVLAVAAHGLAHIITRARFGATGDGLLGRGLATWAAEESWKAWQGWPSLHEAMRGFIQDGTFIPLAEANQPEPTGFSTQECWARRDRLYTAMASFVGYLIEEYGHEAFGEVWATAPSPVPSGGIAFWISASGTPILIGTPIPVPTPVKPDYETVYGKSFESLEAEWLNMLTEQSR